jgi:hypothetical protein
MDINDFKQTLANETVPDVNDYLKSLWYVAKGDWSMAHLIARDIDDVMGYWIHGHLHRAKGDDMNAQHWYDKATKPFPESPVESEWDAIFKAVSS